MLKGLINLDHLKKWYLTVGGTAALAVFLAVGNYCFCAYLNNKDVSKYNQAWIIIIRNMWARVVQIFLITSSHTAFLAMAWSGLKNQGLPVHITDSALRLPAFMPFLNILFSLAHKRLSHLLITTFGLFALAFVTITVPAALVVQPMEPLLATLQLPAVDMSNDPRLYSIMTSSWEYVGPSNHLKHLVRNMLTSDTVLTWNAPPACQHGCSYNVIYDAPVLTCVDYTPNSQEIPSNTSYRANFDILESHLMLNMTFWPMVNGTPAVGDSGLSPLGTRCTFHQGRYTAAMNYLGSQRYASITKYTQMSNDSLLGTSLGFSNSTSCPRETSWVVSDPSGTNPCARIQMNTWAVVDAFSSSLSGAIVTYSQSGSLGPEERVMNSALMPNLDYLFSIHELYQSFDLAPWAKNVGLGKALGSLFANETLSLTSDAYAQNWTSEAHNAFIVPFANKYSYVPRTLWWGYGCAFMTVLSAIISGWGARRSLPNEESALGKILATTSDKGFEELRNRKEGIDDMLICYEQVQKGDDFRMEFMVKSEECGLTKRSSDME